VNAVLLQSLPYREPDQLVKVMFNKPGVALRDIPFSYPEFDDLEKKADVFDQVSVVWPSSGNLTGGKEPVRLELLAVSPGYFSLLGAVPQKGRLFDSRDSVLGFAPVAVISDSLWHRAYGADPNIIGRTLEIDTDPYTIIGILPPHFRHPGRTVAGDVEVWLVSGFGADPFTPERNARQMPGAIGRLKPGLGLQQAQTRLNVFSAAIRKDYASDYAAHEKWAIEIQPLRESLVGNVRPMLVVLLAATILIVLIASVNVANLLLLRASARRRERAVMLALGASPSRLLRQAMTESLLLSLIASVAGILFAAFSLKLIVRLLPSQIPRVNTISIDWTVLAFALMVSIITGVAFSLAPALAGAKIDLFTAINEGSGGSGYGTRTSRFRGALIVSETALAMVLMVGAGLLLRTFWELLQEKPGFNPSKVVAAGMWLPSPNDPKTSKYLTVELQTSFVRKVLQRLNALPGIEAAAITSSLPASAGPTATASISIEGRKVESSEDLKAEVIRVTPAYFNVMDTPLLQGRAFSENDEAGKEVVAIIDRSTAARYFPGVDPVGRHLSVGARGVVRGTMTTVVGVIHDIKHDGLDKDGVPHIYMSVYQNPGKALNIVMRTSLPASDLAPLVRQEVQSVDPGLPVFAIQGMDAVIQESLLPRRFAAQLVGSFAVLALLLAAVGIYGLLGYMVSQRSREIGIRIAMGAQRAHVFRLIVGQGLFLAGCGIGIGLLCAFVVAPMIASLLYGIHPINAAVFIVVPLILLGIAFVASYIPARRASKVDPIYVLRA
jgi:putative ABC transport system permease protein